MWIFREKILEFLIAVQKGRDFIKENYLPPETIKSNKRAPRVRLRIPNGNK